LHSRCQEEKAYVPRKQHNTGRRPNVIHDDKPIKRPACTELQRIDERLTSWEWEQQQREHAREQKWEQDVAVTPTLADEAFIHGAIHLQPLKVSRTECRRRSLSYALQESGYRHITCSVFPTSLAAFTTAQPIRGTAGMPAKTAGMPAQTAPTNITGRQ
jgi:hypothetical protein